MPSRPEDVNISAACGLERGKTQVEIAGFNELVGAVAATAEIVLRVAQFGRKQEIHCRIAAAIDLVRRRCRNRSLGQLVEVDIVEQENPLLEFGQGEEGV